MLIASTVNAQELYFDFSQNRETYSWDDSLVWQPKIHNSYPITFSNKSTTTLIKETVFPDRDDRWQENYRTSLKWNWMEGRKLTLSSIMQNDYSSFEERTVADNSVGVSALFRPTPALLIENTGSFVTTVRNNFGNIHRASGYRNTLTADYSRKLSGTDNLRVSFGQDTRLLPDIPVYEFDASSSFSRLTQKDSLRITANGELQVRRYFTTSRSFESLSRQVKTISGARLMASFKPFAETRIRIQSNLDYRRYRYQHYGTALPGVSSGLLGSDNNSTEINYKITGIRQIRKRVAFDTHYMFRETDEDYGAPTGSQRVRTGEWRVALRAMPGMNDSLWVEAVFSATRYFTDQTRSFFSDRDRLMQLYGAGFFHRFSSVLGMRVDGSYRDFHQTFVSGELSANNNHNSVYVLQPSISWRPYSWLNISNSFLLHANYIWYDYEKKADSDRNTLFRRARWRNEYAISLSHKMKLRPMYTYKYEDFGQLLWHDQWVQKTNWDRRTHLPSLEVTYKPVKSWRISPGVSYEKRKSWEFVLDDSGMINRVEKETFERTTMHLDIGYSPGPRMSITASAQRRVQASSVFSDDKTNQFVISIHRVFW
jgi:hypothetical protein